MIVRRQSSAFVLISQPDHARLSGSIAAAVGNETFAPPSPLDLVIAAADRHDDGWAAADAHPALDNTGAPRHVFATPVEASIPIWSASTQMAISRNPYCGLLVSLHGMHLSLAASAASPQQVFQINRFQHEQVEIQEQLRRQLGMHTDRPLHFGLATDSLLPEEELLKFNFRLLQLFDVVSLNLCFDELRLPHLANILPRPGASPVTAEIRRLAPDEFSVKPWPFAQNDL
ncbi:MAG TPA: DUF3891 family protein, partial [Tepidisphaeraceae bacterium]|nr:DUF3891 family protein [Tepidisphaeraceae bacterium]